jgi:hypothetical protein
VVVVDVVGDGDGDGSDFDRLAVGLAKK